MTLSSSVCNLPYKIQPGRHCKDCKFKDNTVVFRWTIGRILKEAAYLVAWVLNYSFMKVIYHGVSFGDFECDLDVLNSNVCAWRTAYIAVSLSFGKSAWISGNRVSRVIVYNDTIIRYEWFFSCYLYWARNWIHQIRRISPIVGNEFGFFFSFLPLPAIEGTVSHVLRSIAFAFSYILSRIYSWKLACVVRS